MQPSSKNTLYSGLIVILALSKKYWYLSIVLVLIFLIFVFIFILPFILPKSVRSGEISGVIFNNQIWKGDINIVGDTIALPGTTIQIEPGSRILIAKNGDRFNFFVLPWFTKYGINTGIEDRGVDKGEPFWDENAKIQLRLDNVKINGTIDKPVVISSNSHPGSRYDINLISFNRGEISFADLSNYRQLEIGKEVKVKNSKLSHTGDCALCLQTGTQIITGNEFKDGLKHFIKVNEGESKIEDNRFLTSDGDGVMFFGGSDSRIILRNNFFDMPNRTAVKIDSVEQGGVISGNFFNGGNIELPCHSRVSLIDNFIKVQLVFKDIYNNCQGEYLIGSNYWEILDAQAIINARIVGHTEKYHVKIPNFLKSAPVTTSAENK